MNTAKIDERSESPFDPYSDPGITQVLDLVSRYGYDFSTAWDVFFFRHSPNWSLELEQELVKLHSEGRPPSDLSSFGYLEGLKP